MVTCPRMINTTIPESTCIARQLIIRKGQGSHIHRNGTYNDCYNSCYKCRVGLDLLKASGRKTEKSKQYAHCLAAAAERREKMIQGEQAGKRKEQTVPAGGPDSNSIPMRVCSGCGREKQLTTENFKRLGRGYSKVCLVCPAPKKPAGRKPKSEECRAASGAVSPLCQMIDDLHHKKIGNMTISITIQIRQD